MNHCFWRGVVFWSMLFLLQLTVGCTQKHYIQINDESIALYLHNSSATEVIFASSIDRFQLHPATKAKGDMWQVTVPKEGEFSYFYLVDKIPTLPDCQFTVLDDFGARNCLFLFKM